MSVAINEGVGPAPYTLFFQGCQSDTVHDTLHDTLHDNLCDTLPLVGAEVVMLQGRFYLQ